MAVQVEQRLCSPDEAARRLHQAPQTLAQWRSEGRGPAYIKLGRKVFYTDGDLDAYVAGQRRNPQGKAA
jgi:hypothetical protein